MARRNRALRLARGLAVCAALVVVVWALQSAMGSLNMGSENARSASMRGSWPRRGRPNDDSHSSSSSTSAFAAGQASVGPRVFEDAHAACAAPSVRAAAPSERSRKVAVEKARDIANGGYEKVRQGSGDVLVHGMVTAMLSNYQHDDMSLFGAVGEMGVHHGRFTSCLFITADASEALVAVDVFEKQNLNVDGSGHGSYHRFMQAMSHLGLRFRDFALLHKGSTTDLATDWLSRRHIDPFRLVSVDAGHTAELTFRDLGAAACNLAPGGVILVDDFFHPHWTGVTEGLFQYLTRGAVRLYPFLVCAGKVYLTNDASAHAAYARRLQSDAAVGEFFKSDSAEFHGSTHHEMAGVRFLTCPNVDRARVTARWLDEIR